jgi:acyl-coenzyme A thioesterase PaaI-like protein
MRETLLKVLGFRRWINLYPPLRGAGIHVTRISPDARTFDVELRLTWFNRNYMGTQFGGSLFAMTDPFYAIIVMRALGRSYVVWDKAASIRFRRPGMTNVRAQFHIPEDRIEQIRAAVDRDGTHDAVFEVEITDAAGEVVARVERVVYVATKAAYAARASSRQTPQR